MALECKLPHFAHTQARIGFTLSQLPRAPSRIFHVLWNLSLVGHRRVSPAVPGTRPGRPLFHSAFPRASQAPGSQSLAAAKEYSDCFRVGVCGVVGRFHPLDECSRGGHRLSVLGCSFADCLQVFLPNKWPCSFEPPMNTSRQFFFYLPQEGSGFRWQLGGGMIAT